MSQSIPISVPPAFVIPAPHLTPSACIPRSISLSNRPIYSHRPSTPTPRASLTPPTSRAHKHKFEHVSWEQVQSMCNDLSVAASADRFDVVLAITRGGLIPATLLCEALELRNILSATVMFYTDTGEQFFGMTEPRFLSFPSADALEGRRVLVVDDVWDSGRTAHAVKARVQRAKPALVKVAALHYKPAMNLLEDSTPDFYCSTTENWIVYPWETSSPNAPEIAAESHDSARNVADQESASLT